MVKPSNWVPTPKQFWQASVELYQQPGQEARLIDEQDRLGRNVNLHLLSLYLTQHQVGLTVQEHTALERAVATFSQAHTQPLRQLRRQLCKSTQLNANSRQQLRAQLLAAELTLEAQEQLVLIETLQTLRQAN